MTKKGFLKISDGQGIYYTVVREGISLLKIHRGLGRQCNPKLFNKIDLKKYKVILFNQKSYRKSIYSENILEYNNTNNLIYGIDLLLKYLNIDKTVITASFLGAYLSIFFANNKNINEFEYKNEISKLA